MFFIKGILKNESISDQVSLSSITCLFQKKFIDYLLRVRYFVRNFRVKNYENKKRKKMSYEDIQQDNE